MTHYLQTAATCLCVAALAGYPGAQPTGPDHAERIYFFMDVDGSSAAS